MVDFVLNKEKSAVIKLTEENFGKTAADHGGKPWLIDLCEDDSTATNCLSWRSRKLVAAAFDGTINVGAISCNVEEDLCEKLGGATGVVSTLFILSFIKIDVVFFF